MKKTILLAVLLSLAVFISGAIAADAPKAGTTAPAKLEKFGGAIKSVDAMAKSIVVVKGKTEKTFGITAETKITKGKEALKFEDLKAKMNVVVEYKKEMEKNIAVTIKVSTPKRK
jgi:outer membrane lipoprotein-sorting protein